MGNSIVMPKLALVKTECMPDRTFLMHTGVIFLTPSFHHEKVHCIIRSEFI